MSRKAANIILAQVTLKPDSVLGLATGATPLGVYSELVRFYQRGDADFSAVATVNLDEYKGIPRSDPQSYCYFMQQNFFELVNVKPQNIHIPDGMADAELECARYERVIQDLNGIDLQLLGIGRNGHIGFNEPGAEFERGTHLVTLAESTIEANRRFFGPGRDVPRQAYTMGIRSIMGASSILVIASGEAKADILKKSFFGPVTPLVPASVLQLHNNVTLVADEAAMSLITSEECGLGVKKHVKMTHVRSISASKIDPP
jgi:glucosamine-6-phosphate deaminase